MKPWSGSASTGYLTEQDMKNNPHYAPENLMDMLQLVFRLRNDRQLAARLGVLPSQICKIRKRRAPISPAFLLNMHEETGLSVDMLRALMGDFRDNTGPSSKHPVTPPLNRLEGLQRLYEIYRQPNVSVSTMPSQACFGYAGAAG
jgi:transcriptional regulator with XRE-family HTH domain